MLQALLYQATWRESSSSLVAFTDFPGEGQEGVWERRTCNYPTGWTFKKMSCLDSLSSWLMQLHTPKWTVCLFTLCLANVVIFTYNAFPRSFFWFMIFLLESFQIVVLWVICLRKKWLNHLLKCTWISSLCICPWTSLSFFPKVEPEEICIIRDANIMT